MARRATFIDSTRAAYPNTLVLDGGNLFETQQEYQQERGLFLMHAMKMMGYHVIGVGEKDLAYGVSFFRDSAEAEGLLPVSANLADPLTGKLLFKPYAIENVNGIKVGIFSILSPENGFAPAASNLHPDSLKYLNPEETARKIVAELRPQCQMVVGLLNMGNQGASALAGKISGLDLVLVGGQVPRIVPKGEMNGTAYVVSAGIRGQYIGRTVVDFAGGKPTGFDADVIALDDKYVEEETMANARKAFEDDLNDRMAKRQRETEMIESKKRGPDHYTGLESCVKCHKDAHDVWLKTAHASAFNTLVEKQKASMPDCVPCHVTGYKENGGFFSTLNPGLEIDGQKRHLENVQCEACHGMGTKHDTSDPAFVHTSHTVCQKCHTPEQDPTFKFDVAWEKIAH